jgi:hypothetical protein
MVDRPRLPNAVVIGAPRCGTTSLYFYLKQHPGVFLPDRKELHYFSYDLIAANTNGPGDKAAVAPLCATREDYLGHYRLVGDEPIVAEVSPSYLYYAGVAARMLEELGGAKIVAILRHPVEKAFSQYMHLVRLGLETLPFARALEEETRRRRAGWGDIWRYAESSLYGDRIAQYMAVFGEENVHVMTLESLVADANHAMSELFRFLDLDAGIRVDASRAYNRSGEPRSRLVSRFFARDNPVKSIVKRLVPERVRVPLRLAILDANSGQKRVMGPAERQYLTDYFAGDVQALEALLGWSTGWRLT